MRHGRDRMGLRPERTARHDPGRHQSGGRAVAHTVRAVPLFPVPCSVHCRAVDASGSCARTCVHCTPTLPVPRAPPKVNGLESPSLFIDRQHEAGAHPCPGSKQ